MSLEDVLTSYSLTDEKVNDNAVYTESSYEVANYIINEEGLKLSSSEEVASLYFFGNELRVDFDENNGVEFIEFLGGYDGNIQPQILGVNAFEISADCLFDLLKENDSNIEDTEKGYSYAFLDSSVGIYRESTNESVQEMIKEAKKEGYELDEEEIDEERKRAEHWSTLGIGVKGYYI